MKTHPTEIKLAMKTAKQKFEEAFRRRFNTEPSPSDFECFENCPGETRWLFLSQYNSWLGPAWSGAALGFFGGIAIGVLVPLFYK